jgi:hypothetical protein
MQVSDNINVFVSTAEGFVWDVPPEQVAVPAVTELSREAFVAGVTGTVFVREHIKLNLLHPARLEEDDAEAQVRAAWQISVGRCVLGGAAFERWLLSHRVRYHSSTSTRNM